MCEVIMIRYDYRALLIGVKWPQFILTLSEILELPSDSLLIQGWNHENLKLISVIGYMSMSRKKSPI